VVSSGEKLCLKEFLLVSTGHSFYPITLEGDESFAKFVFLGIKKGSGSIPRSPVEKLREAREELRMAKGPGAALDALFGDEQRRLIAEAAEVFGQKEESMMQSLATEIKSAATVG
jgi:hypothetical protein